MFLKALRTIIPLLGGLALCILLLQTLNPSRAASMPSAGNSIVLQPDQLQLTGDVATVTNTVGYCTAPWLANMPAGSIIVGVNPISCTTTTWRGGAVTGQVFLPAIYSPTVYTLKLSWPDRDGKGLHSPLQNRLAAITLDGQTLWRKRTTQLSTFNDYYALQHEPILATIVVTQSVTHTLSISVEARTAWDLSRIELSPSPLPSRIRGIGYSPYRDCQYPDGAIVPSSADIKEDLFRLYHTTNAIRTYASAGVNNQIPALARAQGLPVFAGAWLDDKAEDAAELQALIALANSAGVQGAIVGNEYYLRHRTTAAITTLQQAILQVKNNVPPNVLVTTAEIDNLMFNWTSLNDFQPTINPTYRPILDAVDVVLVHIYPFWNGMPIDGAADFTVRRYKAIQKLIEQEYGQNKQVIIGEAGWPSGGTSGNAAQPSLENQRRYMLEFMHLAEQAGVDYFYFDAFDELWKIEEPGRVGQTWGYSYSDRTAKYYFYGILLPLQQLFPYRIYLPAVLKQSTSTLAGLYSDWSNALPQLHTNKVKAGTTFVVYNEWPEGPGRFVPSGWMGDYQNIAFFGCDRSNPHSGEMAIRVSLANTGTLGWGGIYWQYPENNWGNLNSGIDLTGADRVTFWARSDTPIAQVEFLVGGIGYTNGTDCSHPLQPYPDTVCPKIRLITTVPATWTKFTIDLHQNPPRDLSRVIGGFGWVSNDPVILYLDDVVYEFD